MLQHLPRTRDRHGTLVQPDAKRILHCCAVRLKAEAGKDRLPAHIAQPRDRQLPALNARPELVVFRLEHAEHLRGIRKTRLEKNGLHGLHCPGREVQQCVVDIE